MYYVLGEEIKKRTGYHIYEITASRERARNAVYSLMDFDKNVGLLDMKYIIINTDNGEFLYDNFQSFDAVIRKNISFQTSIFTEQ